MGLPLSHPDPESGWMTEVAPGIRLLVAPNPGLMTLDGTNTWILGGRGERSLVVDPGPLDEAHLRAVHAEAGAVAATVLTHRHLDHSAGVPRFAELTGTGVRAADPAHAVAAGTCDGRLADGQELGVGDLAELSVRVLATPGHTSDSISLLLSSADGVWLLTGDMVLGRGTTVITHPDGDLGAYLDSLEVMLDAVRAHDVLAILPGHGPVVSDPVSLLTHYREHRLQRLEQVRDALRLGDETPQQVVARVYADVDRSVWPAAEQSVRAQLDYLRTHQ
jgi:glyoxylase-like metal-dependent hydrolase (beta-lactamase superfamily II)